MLETDWQIIEKHSPSESALALTNILNGYVESCFPLKHRKVNSDDAPWFDSKTRRKVNRKKRIYKQEGKSEKYRRASRECDEAITNAKKKFFGKVIDKCKETRNTSQFYKPVKLFRTKDTPQHWDIFTFFLGAQEKK